MPACARSQEEIDRVLNWSYQNTDAGESQFPGMSYEEGVAAATEWLIGETETAPDTDCCT